MHVKIMKSMRSDYAGMILPGRTESVKIVMIMKSMRVRGRGGYDRRGAPYEW